MNWERLPRCLASREVERWRCCCLVRLRKGALTSRWTSPPSWYWQRARDCVVSLLPEACSVALVKGKTTIKQKQFCFGSFGLDDGPCVVLASSTAYASKLNLEIFDSLFGARRGYIICQAEKKKVGNLDDDDDLRGKSSSTSPSSSAIFITHPTAVNFSSEVFELISSSSNLGDHPASQ